MNLKEILCPDSQFWNTQRLPAVSTSSKDDLPRDVKKGHHSSLFACETEPRGALSPC